MIKLINWPITLSAFFLTSLGILVIYSSSPELAFQQAAFVLLGFLLYFLISQSNFHLWESVVNPFFTVTLVLLILVLILGFETRGAVRWIPLGLINFQPSELAKPALLLFLSFFWAKNLPGWGSILKSLLWTLPVIILVFKQPDLGTTITLLLTWLSLLLVAKISLKKILILFFIGLLTLPITWLTLRDFQKERVIAYLSPDRDPLGFGYNQIQSTIAAGSGNLFGRGLGHGTQSRLQFLPEYRTDFIFAAIAEELGFLGSLLIIALYLYLINYCLRVAYITRSYMGYLLSTGVALMLSFQTFINIGMNIGLVPITGITLPLLSYGGSSMMATFILLGMVASLAGERKSIDDSSAIS